MDVINIALKKNRKIHVHCDGYVRTVCNRDTYNLLSTRIDQYGDIPRELKCQSCRSIYRNYIEYKPNIGDVKVTEKSNYIQYRVITNIKWPFPNIEDRIKRKVTNKRFSISGITFKDTDWIATEYTEIETMWYYISYEVSHNKKFGYRSPKEYSELKDIVQFHKFMNI
jgi:hypothetical protein